MRWLVLVSVAVAIVACKKPKPEEAPPPAPTGPPKVGHSTAKFKTGSDGEIIASAPANDGGIEADAPHLMGGNGAAAYRDDSGRVHGPGGPVFMGKGVDCDPSHDHCMRDGVWFAVHNVVAGKLFRALPVFTFEDKWYTWRGDPAETDGKLFKTEMAGNAAIPAGTTVIWFSTETSDQKWAESEYEALTSSRWEAGVTQSASSHGTVRITGWGDAAEESIRLIVDTKSF